MRRTLSDFLSQNSLIGARCRTLLDSATPLGPITSDIDSYHHARKAERSALMQALCADVQVVEFCSVGAGAAGEESLIPAKLTLIEPDQVFAAYIRRKHPTAQVIEAPYQNLSVPVDTIYAASLGPWMNADPTLGVDRDFLAFCKRNLKPGGVIVALIYGGLHTGFVLDRRYYLERLIASTDYTVALYGKYRPSGALLVLSEKPRALPYLAGRITPLIENGVILRAGKKGASLAPFVAVSIHALRNIRKVLAEAVYLLRINLKLMR